MIFLFYLIMAPFTLVFGTISSYLTGRMMQLDELTLGNCLRLNLVTSFLWLIPFVALFLFEWYVGSGRLLFWLSPEPRFWIALAVTQGSVSILWFLLTKYVFNWGIGQSCLFGCANGCVSYLLTMLLQFGFYMLLILLAMIAAAATGPSKSP